MKSNFISLITLVMLFCTAPMASEGHEVANQKITLLEAIERISKEYEVYFTFDMTLVANVHVVYEHSAFGSAEEAIANILKGTDLKYKFYDQRFVILYQENAEGLESLKQMSRHLDGLISEGEKTVASTPKREVQTVPKLSTRLMSKTLAPIAFSVTGTVVDQEGEPLIGVNILVKGTNKGTSTDFDGRFILEDIDENAVLVVSYIGYKTQEVPIAGKVNVEIILVPDSQMLDEVVVVGYGDQRRRNITSSVSSISADQFEDRPNLQVAQSLQGKAAGVQIVQNSGSPGSSIMVRVRGTGTVNNSNPLYIIDGNPNGNLIDINPNDIKSIEVLKSASAAAIYGARGANGVILITTKNGVQGMSGFKVNYYSSFQKVHRTLPLANANQYGTLYNQALINGGRDPLFKDVGSLGVGTDWQDAIYQKGSVNNIEMSAYGGGEDGNYFMSGGYFDQKGIVLRSGYSRFNFRINSDYKVNSFISIGENLSFSYGNRNEIPEFGSRNPVPNSWHMDPSVPVKNPDGTWGYPQFSDTKNPVAELELQDNARKRSVFNGNIHSQITLTENLHFNTQYNLDLGFSDYTLFIPTFDIYPLQRNLVSELTRENGKWINMTWDNTLTFKNNFGAHDLDLLGGVSLLSDQSESFLAKGQDLPENANIDAALRYLTLAPSGHIVDGTKGDYGMLSFLGRVNYGFDDTYLFTGNFRIDGSSRFGNKNRYGYFPSVSAGWRISNEDFLKEVNFIDDMKIRGGWGILGNQNSLPNYAFASSINTNLVYPIGESVGFGQAATSLGNENLKWETTEEYEIGIDFYGFDNNITISAGYYNKKTRDMLLRIPIPAYVGVQTPPFVNGGDVLNKGIEVSLGYSTTIFNDISNSISINFSHNTNRILKLSNTQAEIFSSYARTTVGEAIGSYYGYEMDGIFQTEAEVTGHAFQSQGTAPGDIRFKDLNNDGIINQEDRKTIGNPWPKLDYGFNYDLEWKNLNFSFDLYGVYGNDIIAAWKYFTQGSNFYNYDTYMLKAWNGPGSSNSIPRLNVNDPNDNLRNSSYFLENGSYLRMKNIQIGYTIPDFLSIFKNTKIYLSAQNLFTFTKYPGFDPEIGSPSSTISIGIDYGNYPQPKSITAGLSINL